MARSRFDFVKYDDSTLEKNSRLKEAFKVLESEIVRALGGQDTRAKSLAMTKLEESFMWCGKALRDHQLDNNSRSEVV